MHLKLDFCDLKQQTHQMCSVMLYVMLRLWLHAQTTILILILALTEKH